MSPAQIRSSTYWPVILETWAMSCVWVPCWSGVCHPLFSMHFCHCSTQDLGVFHPSLWRRPDRSSSLPVSCSANHLSAEWSWEKDWLARFSWLKAPPLAFKVSSFRDGNGYWPGAWEVKWRCSLFGLICCVRQTLLSFSGPRSPSLSGGARAWPATPTRERSSSWPQDYCASSRRAKINSFVELHLLLSCV